MKFGCCLNMIATADNGIGLEHMNDLKELGYDYAELPLAEMMALPENDFEQLLNKLDNARIPCEACNNFFPHWLRLTGREVDQDIIYEYVCKALERAVRLGAKVIVFGSGKAKHVPKDFPLEDGYAQIAGLLKMIAPIAEEKDIVIVIEPLRKAECNLINTFAEGCRLARSVESEAIKVLVDFYHLTEEGEPVKSIKGYGRDYLRHVHFARPKSRMYPLNIEEAEYGPFIDALKSIQYDARISCEAYTKDFLRDGANALQFFKENFT